jgi:hypothetical protein
MIEDLTLRSARMTVKLPAAAEAGAEAQARSRSRSRAMALAMAGRRSGEGMCRCSCMGVGSDAARRDETQPASSACLADSQPSSSPHRGDGCG